VTYSNSQTDYLNVSVCKWLRDNAVREGVGYRIINDSISYNPGRIVEVTVSDDGSLDESSAGKSSGKSSNKNSSGRGSSSAPSIGSGGDGGGGAGGKVTGNRESVSTGNSGVSLSSGGDGGGGSIGNVLEESDSEEGMTSNSSGRGNGDRNKTLGNIDGIAPLPGMPSLFFPGQTFYRGEVTFRIEILDPKAQNDGGEG
jgi:hypothetical protein